MQLTFDSDVEEFRAEFSAFLDEHLPSEAETLERPTSVSHMPQWARDWQRLLFDNGWLLPAQPPEFGGRNATVLQQFVHLDELCRRRIYHSLNPQGVNIIAASLISFGSDEQKHRWAVPVLRGELTASLGMSEPSAGSDLASLRTRAVLDGDHFVVNGQKVWTSGAHDADFLLTFVRTDPDAPKHKGISALIIPTDTPGVVCRPFADMCGEDNLDFNEVFFTDARVPAENLVGPLNGGWGVANGSLGHERTMMWLGFADRIDNMIADFRPRGELQRDQYATTIMDYLALRAMGSAALAKAARGEMDTASVSVLKLFGSEAERQALENALTAAGTDGLLHPSTTGPYEHMNLDHYFASWFERYARSFGGTIAGGTSEIQRNIIARRCSACRGADPVTETLLVERPHAGVLLVTLNRPQRLNAINDVLRRELTETLVIGRRRRQRRRPHRRRPRLLLRYRHARFRARGARCRRPRDRPAAVPGVDGGAAAGDPGPAAARHRRGQRAVCRCRASRCVWPPTSGSAPAAATSEMRAILLGLSGAEMGMSYHLPEDRRNQRRRRLDADRAAP